MSNPNRIILLLLFILSIFAPSCKKQDESPQQPLKEEKIDIYVAGMLSKDGKFVPGYLKNDEPVFLSTGKFTGGLVTRIIVQGNDVYAIGQVGNVAAYWKNGEMTQLSPNYPSSGASGIVIKNGDVYIAGWVYTPYWLQYLYWKNGTENIMTYTMKTVVDIDFKGDNLLVSGEHEYHYFLPLAYGYMNGDKFNELEDCMAVHDISVAGDDIYASGMGTGGAPAYWKNGKRSSLGPYVSATYTQPYRLFVNNRDVYVCGSERVTVNAKLTYVARYWKNGVAVSPATSYLDPVTGLTRGHLLGIAVYNDNVYTIGQIYTIGEWQEPVLFKNLDRVPLNKVMTSPYDIVVVKGQ